MGGAQPHSHRGWLKNVPSQDRGTPTVAPTPDGDRAMRAGDCRPPVGTESFRSPCRLHWGGTADSAARAQGSGFSAGCQLRTRQIVTFCPRGLSVLPSADCQFVCPLIVGWAVGKLSVPRSADYQPMPGTGVGLVPVGSSACTSRCPGPDLRCCPDYGPATGPPSVSAAGRRTLRCQAREPPKVPDPRGQSCDASRRLWRTEGTQSVRPQCRLQQGGAAGRVADCSGRLATGFRHLAPGAAKDIDHAPLLLFVGESIEVEL